MKLLKGYQETGKILSPPGKELFRERMEGKSFS